MTPPPDKTPAKRAPAKKASAKKAPAKKAPAKKRAARTRRPRAADELPSAPKDAAGFPRRIFAIASPRSVGGVSLFEPGVVADSTNVANFASDENVVLRAAAMLQDAGFEVLQANSVMINIAGSRQLYESQFATTIVAEERPTMKEQGVIDEATFFDTTDTDVSGLIDVSGTRFAEVLEGVAIEEPAYLATPDPFPPPVDYWHLDVPADVSLGCNADKAHRSGITGKGVRVAMVDTGWESHPFFTQRGYRVEATVLGPGTTLANRDEHGHGTGESANVFATAPDATLLPVKAAMSSGALVNLTAAFNAAVALNPDIITNSWTSDIQNGPLSAAMQARAAAVAAAVSSGIVVVFAAGNGHWGFPGQHPDVVSVGGVFMDSDGSMRASNYASGFMSNIYPGRRVPDLSGLVGMQPGAKYIMLPLAEGAILDGAGAGGTHPNGDETAAADGWAAFSGTSAACPQVAGVCALIKQACPHLSPAVVRDILRKSARDVTTGTCHPNTGGNAAVVGPDTATGNGLVDAHKAVLLAKLRCIVFPLRPLIPIQPFAPVQPVQPLLPFLPVQPVQPLQPLLPLFPVQPVQPVQPFQPLQPLLPVQPLVPIQPFFPFGPGPGPERAGVELSEDDVAALEQFIIESEEPPEL